MAWFSYTFQSYRVLGSSPQSDNITKSLSLKTDHGEIRTRVSWFERSNKSTTCPVGLIVLALFRLLIMADNVRACVLVTVCTCVYIYVSICEHLLVCIHLSMWSPSKTWPLYHKIAFGPVLQYNDVPVTILAIKEMKSGRWIKPEEDRTRRKKEARSSE